jgi:diguanylate cyclase (GGDEF)-like protein/PAS domain S-box-containing protein
MGAGQKAAGMAGSDDMTSGQSASDAGDNPQALLAIAEELVGLGTWSWQRGSNAVDCSAGLARILGLGRGRERVAARPLLRRVAVTQRRALLATIRHGAPTANIELAVLDSMGQSRTVLSVHIRKDVDGFWGVAHDVTALRSVSAALDQSESRWEIALECARQGVWDSDVLTGEVYHSRTWRALRGMHPAGDVLDTHESWKARVHPDDLERILALIATQQSGAQDRLVFEYRERKLNGEYIWIQSAGQTIAWQPDGRPRRVIGTDTDITQRKRAEAENERLRQRLELALEVSRLGIFEANLQTREVYWDKRVREIYGVPEDMEVPPDYWEHTLHPDDYETAMKRVWSAVENQGAYVSDFRIIRPDGAIRHLHTEGTWYRDHDGVPKMLGVNWDVTEEVEAKRDLERARELAEARNVELEATKQAIEFNAMHDALTGLPNRRYLDRYLDERAKSAAETGGAVSLLHIDLDLFKQINDTLGHVAGDAMLVHVAGLLRAAAGPDAFVARVGGDEFSIVTTLAGDNDQLAALAAEIIARIRRPVPYQGLFCRFGASIGIASRAGSGVDPQRLLIDADIALYRAKGHGKNRFEFFTEALQAETVTTKRVADEILRGIEQNEFFPYFQPLFDAQSMALVGVEALARWRHPDRGILPPASFLRIAEDLNVVTAIDRVILEQTLKHFAGWRAAGLDVPSVSVNVSFRRLHDQQLLSNLRDLDIAPGTLSFELLESIFLDELDDIARFNIDQIREMGIDINIDDFGTGHASIISLLKLRPTRFKLDRAFLEALTSSASQRRLVRSIIEIGKSLGIKVVAEGIESMEQAHILRELGCDIVQGFAFARPMPAGEFEQFMLGGGLRRAS